MPVHVGQRNRLWRILERNGRVAMTPNGKPRDGGGHASKNRALAQMRAMNAR